MEETEKLFTRYEAIASIVIMFAWYMTYWTFQNYGELGFICVPGTLWLSWILAGDEEEAKWKVNR